MKRVSFYATNITGFNEMLKVARILPEHYQCTFILNTHFEGNFKQTLIEQVESVKGILKHSDEITSAFKSGRSLLGSAYLFFLKKTSGAAAFSRLKYYQAKKNCELRVQAYQKYVREQSPDLLILPEDGPGADFALLKAFKLVQKPILVIPYEYSGYNQLLLGAKCCFKFQKEKYDKKYWPLFDRFFFPDGGYYYGFATPEEYMAWDECGVLPLNVKTVHGGIADKLAAESEMMVRHYSQEKLSPEKLVVTGALSDDVLFQHLNERDTIKQKLEHILEEKIDKPIVLFSFIPDSTYNTKRVFTDYREYIVSVTDTLSRLKDYKVIYQFHPAVSMEKKAIFNEMHLPLVELPTAELMAVTDLYITSYSSTIRWAIACKVPVINFDIYDFRFEDFNMCAGVKGVSSNEAFTGLIDAISKNKAILGDLKNLQAADSGKWAILDGKSGGRILTLIEKLCEHSS